MNRRICLASIGLLLLAAAWSVAHAKEPLPAGPMAPTRFPYIKQVLVDELRIVDEYDEHTKDPRELRESAHKLLTAAKRVTLGMNVDMTREQIHNLGKELMEKGSRDPLVVAITMQSVPNLDAKDEIKTNCDQAIADVLKQYEPRQQIDVLTWCQDTKMGLYNTYRRERSKFKLLDWKVLNDAYIRWIASDAESLDRQRHMWVMIDFYYLNPQAYFGNQLVDVARRSKAQTIHPWMRAMLDARIASDEGAEAHRKGEPGYKEHFRKAASHYEAAWKIAPQFPEAPTALIHLARGGHIEGTPRDWFDRAVAAEFDHPMAYTYYRSHLRSEGTEALIAFGKECAATKRYDTKVPFELLECLWAVENSTGDNIWQRDGVYELVSEFCEEARQAKQFQDQPQSDATRAWLVAVQIAVAARANRFDEIAPLWKQTNEASLKQAMYAYRVKTPLPALKATADAAISEATRLVNVAEKALAAARDEKSIASAQQTIEATAPLLKEDDPRVAQWRASLAVARDFYSGRWADVKFPEQAAKLAAAPKWQRIDERTLVTRGTYRFPLDFLANLPAPYEVSCQISTIEMPDDVPLAGIQLGTERPEPNKVSFGNFFGLNSKTRQAAIHMHAPAYYSATFKDTNELRIRAWHGHRELFINGERVTSWSSYNFRPTEYFALWAPGPEDAKLQVQFSHLRIRRIPYEAPPARKDATARVEYYTRRIEDEPDSAEHYLDRADANFDMRKVDEAVADFQQAVKLKEDWKLAILKLGIAHAYAGEYQQAIDRYEQLLKMPPSIKTVRSSRTPPFEMPFSHAQALNHWAWLLATCRDENFRNGAQAVKHAQRVIQLSKGRERRYFVTLAAAHAEAGDFKAAKEALKQAGSLFGEPEADLLVPLQEAFDAQQPFRAQ